MSAALTEIYENTKMGRESALLGDYETSQVLYNISAVFLIVISR